LPLPTNDSANPTAKAKISQHKSAENRNQQTYTICLQFLTYTKATALVFVICDYNTGFVIDSTLNIITQGIKIQPRDDVCKWSPERTFRQPATGGSSCKVAGVFLKWNILCYRIRSKDCIL